MAHRYGLPIRIEIDGRGEPISFVWRGKTWHCEVIGSWHLVDHWWVTPVWASLDVDEHGDLAPDPAGDQRYKGRRQCGGIRRQDKRRAPLGLK
jgi:hypothetical protein